MLKWDCLIACLQTRKTPTHTSHVQLSLATLAITSCFPPTPSHFLHRFILPHSPRTRLSIKASRPSPRIEYNIKPLNLRHTTTFERARFLLATTHDGVQCSRSAAAIAAPGPATTVWLTRSQRRRAARNRGDALPLAQSQHEPGKVQAGSVHEQASSESVSGARGPPLHSSIVSYLSVFHLADSISRLVPCVFATDNPSRHQQAYSRIT